MTIYTTTGTQFSKAGITVSYTDETGATATQNVTFANKVMSLDSGLNVTAGKADFAGAVEVHGATQLDSTLDVTGASHLHNTVVVDGAATLGSSLAVAGATNLNTLSASGATYLNTLGVMGAASLNTLSAMGAANLSSTLNVGGAANLNSSLAVAGAASLNNTLAVTGAANLNNTLAVAGAASLNDSLTVTGPATMNNYLVVSGETSLNGRLNVSGLSVLYGDMSVGGSATITGAASLNNTLAVSGAASLNNTLAVAGAANMNSSLNVAGATTLVGALDVKAASHLENTLLVDGAATLGAALTVAGATTLNNGMTVNGTSTHNGAMNVSGAATVGGALSATGAAVLGSSLDVAGAATLSSTLDVVGAAHLSNTLAVDGAASLGSSLAVAGASNLAGVLNVTGASHLSSSILVDGAANLGNTLAVSGAASMASTLAVTGAATMSSSLAVTGAANLNNTLAVAGAASLNDSLAVAGAASLNNTLAVTGAASLNNTLAVTGAASLNNTLAVTGAANLNNTLAVAGAASLNDSLAVAGAASMNNTLAVTGAASLASSLAVTGAASLNNTLAVTGAASLNNTLAVSGAASLNNTLAVSGAASLNNTLAVSGAASMASSLAVTGAANLNNTLAVTGAASLNNTLAVSGAASLASSLAVTGAATFQNNVTVNGNLTVLGSQTAIDTTSLQVKDNAILLADGNTADVLPSGIQLQYKPSGSSDVKYAGMKRLPQTGEFVFFKDSAKTIDDPSVSEPAGTPFIVSPQKSGLSSNSWTQSGVTYTSSASSYHNGDYPAYGPFNNYYGQSVVYSWASESNYVVSSGAYTGSVSTTVLGGVGVVAGEWIQLQLSAPMAMDSYSFACGSIAHLPRQYYIVGSNDGSAWYPVQYGVMASNPFTTGFTTGGSAINVNQSGVQSIHGPEDWDATGSGNFTTYPTTGTKYSYYRLIANAIYGASSGSGGLLELNEWYINFLSSTSAALPTSYTVEWKNLGGASFNNFSINSAVTTTLANANYKFMHRCQGYNLPAGTYSYSASATNDDNYWDPFVLINEYGATVVTVSTGVAPWSTQGSYTGTFTLAKPTMIYAKKTSNQYYAYNTRLTLNLTRTDGSASVFPIIYANSGANAKTISGDDNGNPWAFGGGQYDSAPNLQAAIAYVKSVAPNAIAALWSGSPTSGPGRINWYVSTNNGQLQIVNGSGWVAIQFAAGVTGEVIPTPPSPTPSEIYATLMADGFNCASDARLKKDVVVLDGALDKLDAIRGVHYNWIDEKYPQERQVGVIAQEIQAVYPELVKEGGNGFLSVDYPKLTAVLIQSVKELKAMVVALVNK